MTHSPIKVYYNTLREDYAEYEEGSEIGDAIRALSEGAHILAGLGDYDNAVRVMLIVRENVKDVINWKVEQDGVDGLSEKEKALFEQV